LVGKVAHRLATRARWRLLEYAFWLAALASFFLLPNRHLILTEIAWLALFALSLDLILGYAGIISLGHAAFFGLGSYLAALLAKHGIVNEPVLALRAVKGNPLRAASIGISVNARLVTIYTFAAFYAGIAGALLTQTTAFASLDVFSFERSADLLLVLIIGGTGYLYGGLIGAVIFKLMQDWIANLTPQYWQFWIGLVLVLIVLVGRERIGAWTSAAPALAEPLTRRFPRGP